MRITAEEERALCRFLAVPLEVAKVNDHAILRKLGANLRIRRRLKSRRQSVQANTEPKRLELLQFRANDNEATELRSAARMVGSTVSDFIRDAVSLHQGALNAVLAQGGPSPSAGRLRRLVAARLTPPEETGHGSDDAG